MTNEFASQDKTVWDRSKEWGKHLIKILAIVGVGCLGFKYLASKAALTLPRIS